MFPKPTYKKGGINSPNPSKLKPSKNDRAMVSGVSSILKKIKDKKNRKEVAGSMVNQFNREGVNYNKEKFLKNSRSYQFGGASRADSLNILANSRAVQNYYAGRNYKRSAGSMSMRGLRALADLDATKVEYYSRPNEEVMTPTGNKLRKLIDYYQRVDNNKFYQRETANAILDTRAPRQLFDRRIEPTSYLSFTNINERDPMHGDAVGTYSYDPISVTPWDMLNTQQRKQRIDKYGFSGTPYKNKADYINKTTTAKKPKATTSTSIIPAKKTTTTTTTPTTTPTSTTQTPRQLPVNSPQMQRYNYMSTEDKKRAVKKYGDPSKVPNEGVDINQLRREVPTFQAGGFINKKSQKAKLSQLYKIFKLRK